MSIAVIFDMDGVIIDSEPVHLKVSKSYFQELGVEILDDEYQTFIGITNKEIYTKLKSKHNLQQTVENLVNTYEKRYMQYLKSVMDEKPIPGVVSLLEDLSSSGIPIALASSAPKENITTVLKLFCIENYFQTVVSGNQVQNSKPSPDIFLYAADLLKVKPSDCLVIEDSSNGVKAAKAAGMRCIAFKNPNTGKQDLSLADLIIDSFNSKCIEWILQSNHQ